jgi:D-glycero-D-manno-heptose 1,7-bisphosphate phosphatase
MLKKAEKEFSVDLRRSFVVGDRCVDIKTGQNAGCTPFLVLTGYGKIERSECINSVRTGRVADNAYDAWLRIKKIVRHRDALSRPTVKTR